MESINLVITFARVKERNLIEEKVPWLSPVKEP